MFKVGSMVILLVFASSVLAKEKVLNSVSFESGAIQRNGSSVDGGFIKTLPDPQRGKESIKTGRGGCGPSSNCDMRVVSKEKVGGQQIGPRAGKYFLRMKLDKKKNYTGLNGGLPKPRTSLLFSNDKYRFDHDVEEWIGFSVFIPKDFEDETKNVGLILTEITADSAAQFLKLSIGMRNGDRDSRWYFHHRTSDRSVSRAEDVMVDLGSIEADKGKWTDFIIRVRSNPFKKATNPAKKGIAGARNKVYQGNKGILQVWKAEGPVLDSKGNRKMASKIRKINEPVGLVPGRIQGKDRMSFSARAYKPGWQGHRSNGTSVKGPIWIAWDEVRFGEAGRHSTSYEDVHPTGRRCESQCPSGAALYAAAPPAAPTEVRVELND